MAENIEYQWVEKNLPKKPCRLLNFGSAEDETVELFIKKGYSIVGVDLQFDPRVISGYEFKQGDLLKMKNLGMFDCIYSISAVEHVGLPRYNNGIFDNDGDKKAVKKLYECLNPDGILLISFPYGASNIIPKHLPFPDDWRIYNKDSLSRLLEGYNSSVTFFLAISEYIRLMWLHFHEAEPPPEAYEGITQKKPLTDGADQVFSVACIKIWKNKNG